MTIFELIDGGDAEAVRELLARDPGAAAARDEQGLSALMRAFYRGGGEVLEAIRAADPPLDPWDRILTGESDGLPDPGDRSPDGFTPLHIAAFAITPPPREPSSPPAPTRTSSPRPRSPR
jgi:ankyrin repeat protein